MDDILVSDLVLTDEHETVGLDESISSAAEKLLDLGRGVLVVVGEGNKVKGIVTPNQVLAAVAAGADTSAETCGDHMDADVMEVGLDDNVDDIIETMNERKPHAVVAVDANGEFAGYFSPNDYREALARIESKPAIKKLAEHE
jgi:predicted transcriptional regulator